MKESKYRQQALTLAALMQAVRCVKEVAFEGRTEAKLYRPLIEGLLGEYTGDADNLYGSEGLAPGLRRVVEQLEDLRDAETTRYAANIFHLEQRLMKRPEVLSKIGEGLQQARQKADYFGDITHINVIQSLGELYSQTISEMGPRLLVQGEQEHLENSDNAALIRALLLSGIRAASLWRESGGGRIALIFSRKHIARASREILKSLPEQA
ncbi:high frequency lysogenization protein HflD [Halorhodospira halochloris]|uniref:high frequency lysogenization protein HflD n=1 Tax=Halorhodospira halochloris TaxID=1052 RepID=UPI001EE97375|nr:high frequency lysogenization protein HflD [Halorhodospira halochloris]MCG5531588.1 high frequency lysogenization protein HflD [Halorhodospira halochloris]MCG5548566.1 high frequency lysogenization protein HflD [Halorhodospira halochloris]